MIYAIENIAEIWDELLPNMFQYYLDTNLHKQGDFNPDRKRFEYYQDTGSYLLFTARQEGRLVGHCGMYLVKSMYTDAVVATEDGWFLHKDYRKVNNSVKAYQFVENELIKRNIKQLTMTTELKISRFMSKLGYNQEYNQYSKYLIDGADSALPDKQQR